jgi:pimeloyl-ACP methyl ester carboxylesterase
MKHSNRAWWIAGGLALLVLGPAGVAKADETKFLERPGGKVAYSDSGGDGPVVICVPGIGDTRAEYRFLAPKLEKAGFRVITMDPRGMGESDVTFSDYSAAAVGSDIVALAQSQNGQPVYVIGNSAAGASAVWAAAEAPNIRAIVLIDPFVRDVPVSLGTRMALEAAMHRPWGPVFWSMYYGSLYKAAPPSDLPQYREALKANLKEPGRFEALQAMVWASKGPCEAKMSEVHASVLVIMGSADSDFDSPAAEAKLVADRMHGEVFIVPGAGHYPHVDQPEMVASEVVGFVGKAPR